MLGLGSNIAPRLKLKPLKLENRSSTKNPYLNHVEVSELLGELRAQPRVVSGSGKWFVEIQVVDRLTGEAKKVKVLL